MYLQQQTKDSVLLVGVGALGCAAARMLVGAGVAKLTIIDPDRIELSNLQRQVLFGDSDVGAPKAEAARKALAASAGGPVTTEIRPIEDTLNTGNAESLVSSHDFVIDACDDPATKFMINAVAVSTGTAFCYGGVIRTTGQWMTVVPGVSACLACAFPDDHPQEADGGCSAMGILAPVAGLVGTAQAQDALRYLGGDKSLCPGRMNIYELSGCRWRHVYFPRDPACPRCSRSGETRSRPRGYEPAAAAPGIDR